MQRYANGTSTIRVGRSGRVIAASSSRRVSVGFTVFKKDDSQSFVRKGARRRAKALARRGKVESVPVPEIDDDEVLVKVVSDSICMSTYKCATLGVEHKRVHEDVAEHPAIMGHEFAGDIVEVGAKWADRFKPGMKFTIQPALNYKGTMWSPGYSYEFCGGDATYCILPAEVMECDCLLEYTGEAYYQASLAEPI